MKTYYLTSGTTSLLLTVIVSIKHLMKGQGHLFLTVTLAFTLMGVYLKLKERMRKIEQELEWQSMIA